MTKKHARSGWSIAFDGRGHDVWGIIFVLVGLVAALGTYANAAGPLGEGVDDLFGWGIGLLRVFAPIVLRDGLAMFHLARTGAHGIATQIFPRPERTTFEILGRDYWLSGVLNGAALRGVHQKRQARRRR